MKIEIIHKYVKALGEMRAFIFLLVNYYATSTVVNPPTWHGNSSELTNI